MTITPILRHIIDPHQRSPWFPGGMKGALQFILAATERSSDGVRLWSTGSEQGWDEAEQPSIELCRDIGVSRAEETGDSMLITRRDYLVTVE